jgi:hypothetical protein
MTRAYCAHCRHRQTFIRVEVRHWFHFLLTLATVGFWGISWLAISLAAKLRPWRCEHCGWHKPEFLSYSHPRNIPSKSRQPGQPAQPTPEMAVAKVAVKRGPGLSVI